MERIIPSNSLLKNKDNKNSQTKVIGKGAEATITLEKRKPCLNEEVEPCQHQIINSKEQGDYKIIAKRKIAKKFCSLVLLAQDRKSEIFSEPKSLGEALVVTKNRIPKSYRLKILDEKLRKQRTKKEAKILEKSKNLGINVPKVFKTDEKQIIEMEFIRGDKLSETLNDYDEKKQKQTMELLGQQVTILHNNDIIHGDLTTSNVILTIKQKNNEKSSKDIKEKQSQKPTSNNYSYLSLDKSINNCISNKIAERKSLREAEYKVYIIDFGLSFISHRIEDKAVDLHLIKQALEAKHYQNWKDLYKSFLRGYKPKEKEKILKQLEKVELRGRYKH